MAPSDLIEALPKHEPMTSCLYRKCGAFSLAIHEDIEWLTAVHCGCATKWWRCCIHTHWEHGNTSTRTWSHHFRFTMEEGKERKRHDTIWKIGDNSKDFYKERVKMWYYIHGERLTYKGTEWKVYKRGEGGEGPFYVGEGKQVRERASNGEVFGLRG